MSYCKNAMAAHRDRAQGWHEDSSLLSELGRLWASKLGTGQICHKASTILGSLGHGNMGHCEGTKRPAYALDAHAHYTKLRPVR